MAKDKVLISKNGGFQEMEVLLAETGMELRLHTTTLIYFTSRGKTSVDLDFLLARFKMRISTS